VPGLWHLATKKGGDLLLSHGRRREGKEILIGPRGKRERGGEILLLLLTKRSEAYFVRGQGKKWDGPFLLPARERGLRGNLPSCQWETGIPLYLNLDEAERMGNLFLAEEKNKKGGGLLVHEKQRRERRAFLSFLSGGSNPLISLLY